MFDNTGIFSGIVLAHINPIHFASYVYARMNKPEMLDITQQDKFSLTREDVDGVGFVNITGPIIKNSSYWGYGSDAIVASLYNMYADKSIKTIIMRIDSAGGDAAAGFAIAQAVAVRNKPVIVHTDFAASAAYLSASPADEIIAAPQYSTIGGLGAIYIIEESNTENPKLRFIRSEISPKKNEDTEKALSGDYSGLQEKVNKWGEMIADAVAAYRYSKNDYREIKSYQEMFSGDVFVVKKAKELGLIDSTGNIEYAVRRAKKIEKYGK